LSPTTARAAVILLSFVVLGVSAVFATLTWSLLAPLEHLPRALLSLLVFVTAYYLGANVIFWKSVVRISNTTQLSRKA
jgi:hypothetical protein